MEMRIREETPALEGAERRGAERSEDPRSVGLSNTGREPGRGEPPDPEVLERPQRRRFTAEYKLRIVREADACRAPGEVGALLRREGLYSSLLSSWRRERDVGARRALAAKKRGRKLKARNPMQGRVDELERENRRLKQQLEQAQVIIEVQKKLSEVLGIPIKTPEEDESD